MAIGARDYIDKLLVKKYAEEKVDNHEGIDSLIDATKMLETMNDYAGMQRQMLALSSRLRMVCYSVNARNARYRKIRPMKGVR